MKLLSVLVIILLPVFSFSAIVTCPQGCNWQDMVSTFKNFISSGIRLAFLIALLFATVGAFLLMFHGPRKDLYAKGKDLIYTAIIGFILILLAGVIFDIILDFFKPKLPSTFLNYTFAAEEDWKVFYEPLRNALGSSLRCGQNAQPLFNSQALGKLFKCIFEAIGLLRNIALILLGFAIIASGAYLILTPLLGLKSIERAFDILKWSIVGFIIIFLAEIIRDQILKVLTIPTSTPSSSIHPPSPSTSYIFSPSFPFYLLSSIGIDVTWQENSVRVCPPSIFGEEPCNYPDLEKVVTRIIDFILQISPYVLVILIVLGGFMYMLVVISPERVKIGRTYIYWAVVGYVILLLISLVFSAIKTLFGGP